MVKPEIVLDIDQTLAQGVVPAHMALYSRKLRLGMDPDAIAQTASYPRTFDVPQILKFRNQVTADGQPDEVRTKKAERIFQKVRAEIRTSPEVHLAFQALPGSVEGVRQLLEIGGVSYYTVRPHEVNGATKEWLAQQGFPNPEEVVICDSPADKLTRILNDRILSKPEAERGPVILIDDRYEELAEAAQQLQDPELKGALRNLVLVGFTLTNEALWQGSFYPGTGLRTLALPSWQRPDVEALKKEIQ